MDFTISKYEKLCREISNSRYKVFTVNSYLMRKSKGRFILLRHDVDRSPKNALKIAKIENKFGLKSTFYFRTKTFDSKIIREIRKLGHEVGYHYETLDKAKGDFKKAIELFRQELKQFRKVCSIKTICMHGNPLTKWVNSDLWKKYDFRKFGILGEAYLSINFKNLEYFTDTGRTWHHDKYNIKDIPKNYKPKFNIKSTDELILLVKKKKVNAYILTHPCRWSDNIIAWLKELIFQNVKNIGKFFLKWSGEKHEDID